MKNIIDIKTKKTKLNKVLLKGIGSCHAYLALREDYRDHLRLVQKEISFENIRAHGILLDDVGIFRIINGKPVFNFQNLDKIYDFFLEIGIRPFVELSFMPEDLANEKITVFHYKANICPPVKYTLWERLITELVKHCIDRYGLNEVLKWKFEVWNEPDLGVFWAGTQKEYFKLYRISAKAIKGIDPKLQIGGPSTSRNRWVAEFLSYCQRNKLPLDFISTHMYCADVDEIDGVETKDVVYRGQKSMLKDVLKTRQIIEKSKFPDAEFYYTEWNVSPKHNDIFGKDSEFTASFLLSTTKDVSDSVDMLSFWTFSDIFEEDGPGLFPFSGKYGLLNINGIKKPVYHAFKFFSMLYSQEIKTDISNSYFTVSDENIRLLIWNLCEPKKVDFDGGDWIFQKNNRNEEIYLENIYGKYRLQCFEVSAGCGNSFRAWGKMGKKQYLSDADIKLLRNSSEPALVEERTISANGEIFFKVELKGNTILFYDIKKLI